MKLEVISQSQLSGIYQKFHDVVGHPGMIATVNAIQQRYSCTWPGMYKDIENYVGYCNNTFLSFIIISVYR